MFSDGESSGLLPGGLGGLIVQGIGGGWRDDVKASARSRLARDHRGGDCGARYLFERSIRRVLFEGEQNREP